MKLYFLVEGLSSEMKAYPEWIKAYLPNLDKHNTITDFMNADSGTYFFSGKGYPSVLNKISKCMDEIIKTGNVDYFFIILDADDEEIDARKKLVQDKLDECTIPERLKVVITIQKRCFETILMGNKVSLPRYPKTELLREYYKYYNAVVEDPELMPNFSDEFTHSQFHFKYAITAFRERKINYSKSNCSSIATKEYFQKICERIKTDSHLTSMLPFVNALDDISNAMNQ